MSIEDYKNAIHLLYTTMEVISKRGIKYHIYKDVDYKSMQRFIVKEDGYVTSYKKGIINYLIKLK